jgi:hypothetical protein
MLKTSEVLLSLILSSLMRHHLLLPFFALRLKELASLMDAAFSWALSFSDRMLIVRDKDAVPVLADEGGNWRESVSDVRGADVGAGPRCVDAVVSWEENDRVDGESSLGVEGTGDPRSLVLERLSAEMRGLCIADGATDGAALG